jgi:hypothetical protein
MRIITDTRKLIEKMQLFDNRLGDWIFFVLWPRQVQFLDVLHSQRKVIILKKRQTGISQLSGADSLAHCMILPKFIVLILSKTGPDAEVYLSRVSGMYNSLPQIIKDAAPIKKDGKTEMIFHNGSKIISLPANRGAGYTADRVIIDEAAFVTKTDTKIDLQTTLQRVEPTLDKAKGQLILISTANGMNLFYEYWKKAEQRISKFYAFFFACWDDPTFTPEEREQKVKDFGEDHTNQEYPRTAREAFLVSGRPRFSIKTLQLYEENKLLQPIFVGNLYHDSEEIEEDDRGNFEIYTKRIEREQYIITADVAEGIENELTDPDYSTARILRVATMEIVAQYHTRIEAAMFGTILVKLAKIYNNAIIIVERNNNGLATLTQIRNTEEYPEELLFEHGILTREKSDADYNNPAPRLGWITSVKTRPLIIAALAKAILKEYIPALPKVDLDELYAFVIINGKAQANGASHDDRVITLAIAYYLLTLDSFYDFYVYDTPQKYECCKNCEHYIFQDPEEGLCNQTRDTKKSGNYCKLFEQYDPNRDSIVQLAQEQFSAPDRYLGIGG